MSTEQTVRFWWSICHALIAGYTLARASGSLAQTALSHLLLYDSLGALACVVVDVLGNFEAWKRSSIRHPFGLERAEVLAGFAMSVLLLFMGMDLISHIATHALEGVGDHEPHVVHEHEHERSTMGEVDLVSLLALAATLISALGLQNHARIGRHMRFTYFSTLPSILSNPSHFLTITCSLLLLLLPLFSDMNKYLWFDKALAATIAISMCLLGGYLVHELGLMLLMSYSGRGVHEVIRDIELDPLVLAVEEAKIWQVHFGLCMANLKLRVRGTDENLARLRDRIGTLVKNKLGGGYGGGRGGLKWEATTQMIVERLGVGE
jgi:Co/Zn/Cd efflux system component